MSGTGALTGIIMAYETATGETIDKAKKDIATQEVVVTRSARVEAIIFAVTYCRFAVLTLIPPDSVGLM